MTKRDKLRRLVSKHPEIKEMGYPEFKQRYPKQDICIVEYHKVLHAVRAEGKKVSKEFASKADLIRAALSKRLQEHGEDFVRQLSFGEVKELQGKVKPDQFYKIRLRVLNGGKQEDVPPISTVNEALVKKAKELMALAQAAGLVDIKLENGKLTARRMEEISIAI